MRELYHPPTKEVMLSAVLHALSDPTRLEIIRSLDLQGEHACGYLGVGVPKSTLSHHFKVLREAGVIRTRIDGTQRFVSLRRDDLNHRFPGLLDAVLQASGPW